MFIRLAPVKKGFAMLRKFGLSEVYVIDYFPDKMTFYRAVVLNLFDSRHPSFVVEQFAGTPGYNLLVNIDAKFRNWRQPQSFLRHQRVPRHPVENHCSR